MKCCPKNSARSNNKIGMAYESGTFLEAEVKDSLPASGYQNYDGRELTYYPFTAYICRQHRIKG